MKNQVYSILVGGKAGEGVKKAAQVIGSILSSHGKHVVQMDDYQSLIKGGHNFSVVSASVEDVFTVYGTFDLIICFDKRSIDEHAASLKPGGSLFYNSDDGDFADGIPLPLSSLMKRHYTDPRNVSIAATAVICSVMGLSPDLMSSVIKKQYKLNFAENIVYAQSVYELVQIRSAFLLNSVSNEDYKYHSGNQLIVLGAWYAGLDFYYGYPMTPASSILHYIALKKESLKMYAIHAESELAAINMAIGSAIAGCRAAVGSSGGGFALMQEAFSLAGMAEVPLLCVLSSRPGPSTGVSTYTAQEDLLFALHQGHGEFSRVVASPDSFERAFTLAAELLSLAWQVQIPVILLTEKHMSEGMANLKLNYSKLPDTEVTPADLEAKYERYQVTESGVSPLAFPGDAPSAVIKWSSQEHQASGLRTDAAADIVLMKDKRQRKTKLLIEAIRAFQRVAEYGEGENLVFAYGSTVLELREAQKHCEIPFKIIAPIYLEPFPEAELLPYQGKIAVVVEHSCSGAFAEFLSWKLQLKSMHNILKYDGRQFDPIVLAQKLTEVFNA